MLEHPNREVALQRLDRGETAGLPAKLILEGATSADCLIECERLVIWIEGKRNDWLDYSTTWDVTRDQLARNAEAAWLYTSELGKQSCVIVCHEHDLKYHEQLLIEGYRNGIWVGGWPHLNAGERQSLGTTIATLRWERFGDEWPEIGKLLV